MAEQAQGNGKPQKKPPAKGRGWQACWRYRIQAPLREVKREAASCPIINLSNIKTDNKCEFDFKDIFDI
jgi:hypothetical protein